MRRLPFFLVPLLFFACTTDPAPPAAAPEKPLQAEKKLRLTIDDPNWNDWFAYYRTKKADFNQQQFVLQDSGWTEKIPGTIRGNFDPEFDPIYEPFLVWSPDKTKYVDFDSYQWGLEDNEMQAYGPDQEIDLVDVRKKTVRRLAFFGPSQTVENVAWKDDQTIVLLTNSPDSGPSIILVNLRNGRTYTYVYDGDLARRSGYSEQRIEQLLNDRMISGSTRTGTR